MELVRMAGRENNLWEAIVAQSDLETRITPGCTTDHPMKYIY